MAAERKISIQIDTLGNVSGIDAVTAGFKRSEGAADQLFAALKAGAAIDIGGRLVSGLARIPEAFQQAIERGVQFNATLEGSRLGIAAVMKQFDEKGKFKSFDDAMAASADAIELLKQKAKESPATFQSLVQSYQALAGPLTAANIPMEKQVDLIVNMSQALAGLGIRSEQLLQETRALVTGNINADAAAAKILGISAADVAGAKARGQLYEFLSGKIAAFAEAGKRGSQTYTTAMSNLEDAIDAVLAKVTKPIFESLTKGTLDLTAALDDPAIVESLRDIGEQIGTLVKAGYDLTEWGVKNTDVLVFLAKAAVACGAGFTAIKLTTFVLDLGKTAVAFLTSRAAIEAETAALTRNTVAQGMNAAARKISGPVIAAAGYGRAAGSVTAAGADAAAMAQRARLANAGRYIGSVVPTAAAGAGEAVAGGAVATVASVVLPLVIAAVAIWFIRSQKNAALNAHTSLITETSDRYGDQFQGNLKAMASMATQEDKLAVSARIRAQMAQVEEDRYAAIAQGDEQRVQMASQQLVFLEKQHAQLDGVFARVHAIAGEERDRLRLIKEANDFIKYSDAVRVERQKDLPAARSDFQDALTNSIGTDAAKLTRLRSKRDELPSWEAVFNVQDQIDKMHNGAARDSSEDSLLRTKTAILDIEKQIADVEKSISASLADQIKKMADQVQARADYILDYQILQAKAAGEDKVVTALEAQKSLRAEIKKIMDSTGATEEEAERAARRKLSLEWQLGQKKNAVPATGGSGLQSSGGLKSSGGLTSIIAPETSFSLFDNRAVQGLAFGGVVPRVSKPKIPTGSPDADIGGLAGAVKDAEDAFAKDDSLANKRALSAALQKLTKTIQQNANKESPVIRQLLADVATLQSQMANAPVTH